ncbi:16S rRNA (cytidine(1402)-2'-O)-methyltransferase [Thioalbus denitrificans]|uniref:Ribosomal RNA small subunit methyltransferase I n=1 Tax=Thioalbus denitrificans TaxID=547122 RepID=A0A369CH70_9GAMM|nr:16S rRNA (cytidine(1402)-2'-O)-methyltransferase [Thioalbus denitrificans]RCX33422.1 16S rRNA (cytidine1402-2'-O)-methyltransferase [Thioalbus denitrificans]
MATGSGILYIVATPLGNLGDMTPRAVAVLREVDLIAAEDTRHSTPLLRHFAIATPITSLHEHNEAQRAATLLDRVEAGQSLALISDAGTPLLSDPGFLLVREARSRGLRVSPVPGPSALVAALSVAGLPVERFVFEGFLPARSGPRRTRLEALAGEARTLAFYESPHRIRETLADMAAVLGGEREAVLARELTKIHETVRGGSLAELVELLERDPDQRRGEFVILVHGAPERAGEDERDGELVRQLAVLLGELPLKQAVQLAVKLTGRRRNEVYRLAMRLSEGD